MWSSIWQWALDNYIFHTFMVAFVVCIFIFPNSVKKLLTGFKKIKAGSIELQAIDPNIDPETPCPYVKSRDITFNALRKVDEDVTKLKKEVEDIKVIAVNMSIDQQKQLFYDTDQPDAERLAGGLKYLYQGGNGHVKDDVIAFAKKHQSIYNALVYVKPELRIKLGEVNQ